MKPANGRSRVIIEEVTPQVDGGRHPVRRTVGDTVVVGAAIFGDGHDHVRGRLLYRRAGEGEWRFAPMIAGVNDLWSGSFAVDSIGMWQYAIVGWVDHFDTWVSDLRKRLDAQVSPASLAEPVGAAASGVSEVGAKTAAQDIPLALRTGALLLKAAAGRAAGGAKGADGKRLMAVSSELLSLADERLPYYDFPLEGAVVALAESYPDLKLASRSADFKVWVDRERARFSSWYEIFPRSASPVPGKHGTFADVEQQIPEIAAMGFDVLYLPPIHPIGRAFRKGKNNSVTAEPGDVGSPWAIGDREAIKTPAHKDDHGGHTSLLPELGTFADFERLSASARKHGMEIALDIAFQCSPDHPWVTEHPSWFVIRPDGSIQYAENPPKKYQDIYPLNFESSDWRGLWDELRSVFQFWIDRGVKIFRVDNPHTKAFPFWEWCIGTLRAKQPDVIFLAEAFTRPHVTHWLAKTGYTQSYTYFTWRNTKLELQTYLEEITRPPVSDFFGPNFWPNTPDILHKSLQDGGRNAFEFRVILAATLTANYGIYGPAYELSENAPARPAAGKTESEEYLDSEKYEIRQRDRNATGSLVPLITRLNQIRHANPALQVNSTLRFHAIDNPMLICYSKSAADFSNTILVIVNLDPVYPQSGWTDLDLAELDLADLDLLPGESYEVEDLLNDAVYTWRGRRNFVSLRPGQQPAHILRVVR